MNTGISSDATKTLLDTLYGNVSKHSSAVRKAQAEQRDSVAVKEYADKWFDFAKRVATARDDANAWTSVTTEAEAENLQIEYGIFLTRFATLSARLTADKSAEKVRALEAIAKGTTEARKAYREDGVVKLATEAVTIPPVPPERGGGAAEGLKWAGIGAGAVAFLLLLRKIFL